MQVSSNPVNCKTASSVCHKVSKHYIAGFVTCPVEVSRYKSSVAVSCYYYYYYAADDTSKVKLKNDDSQARSKSRGIRETIVCKSLFLSYVEKYFAKLKGHQ